MDLYEDTIVSEEHTAFLFMAEVLICSPTCPHGDTE
jgi:hypothetical protein